MLITVFRFGSDDDSTGSTVAIDGRFECFFIEDEFRFKKVYGETRIPAGTYPVGVHTQGRLHKRYSELFPDFHQGMLHVQNVPNFVGIFIHIGNDDDDTHGCPCPNQDLITSAGGFRGNHSTAAYAKFYQKVIHAALAGELTIQFIDGDL